jgi:hypothetical protein
MVDGVNHKIKLKRYHSFLEKMMMKKSGIVFESDDSISATKAIHYARTVMVQ